MMYYKSKKTGFTLIELLVTISIISLLSSITLLTLSTSKKRAKDARIQTEIHQIILALEEYNVSHGGYPNPVPGRSGLYCIGSGECMFGGVSIPTRLSGVDISRMQKSLNLIASSFPVFEELMSLDTNNSGYFYLSCGSNTEVCDGETEQTTSNIIYPKVVDNKMVFMKVGEFSETSCDLNNVCETSNKLLSNGGSCSQNNQCKSNSCVNDLCKGNLSLNSACSTTSDCTSNLECRDGVCSYPENDAHNCGSEDNQSCLLYCNSAQSLNYDENGQGACVGTWFTSDSRANTYGYTYSIGWAGYGFYGDDRPSGHTYFEGQDSCINIGAISSSVTSYSVGNYCSSPQSVYSCTGTPTSNCNLNSYDTQCNSSNNCVWSSGTNDSCSGTPSYQLSCNGSDSSSCTSVSGCTWGGGTPGSCTIDPSVSCNGDSYTCSSVNGCFWDYTYSVCAGSPSIYCSYPDSCGSYCVINYGTSDSCSGTPSYQLSCNGSDSSSCTSVNGCSWGGGVPGSCNTVVNSCSSLSDMTSCTSVNGCSWTSN